MSSCCARFDLTGKTIFTGGVDKQLKQYDLERKLLMIKLIPMEVSENLRYSDTIVTGNQRYPSGVSLPGTNI
jgi:hypothetical protein